MNQLILNNPNIVNFTQLTRKLFFQDKRMPHLLELKLLELDNSPFNKDVHVSYGNYGDEVLSSISSFRCLDNILNLNLKSKLSISISKEIPLDFKKIDRSKLALCIFEEAHSKHIRDELTIQCLKYANFKIEGIVSQKDSSEYTLCLDPNLGVTIRVISNLIILKQMDFLDV